MCPQEPYASDDLQYDDNRVTLSSKVHFLSNTGDTKWTRQHLHSIPVSLNADSEKMRRLYARSAPTGGTASRRMGIDPHKLRTRSNLYLPLKASVPPELVKLRKEVEEIIKSVQEDNEDFDERQLLKENALLQTQSSQRPGDSITNGEHVPHPPHHHSGGGKEGPGVPGSQVTHTLAAKLQSIQVSPDRYAEIAHVRKSLKQS